MPETKELVDDHYGVPDAENPEWTKEMFARAKRFTDLPPGLQAKLSAIQETARKKRAAQQALDAEPVPSERVVVEAAK